MNSIILISWKSDFLFSMSIQILCICIHFLTLCNPFNQQMYFYFKSFAWFLSYLWLKFFETLCHAVISTHHHLFCHFQLLNRAFFQFGFLVYINYYNLYSKDHPYTNSFLLTIQLFKINSVNLMGMSILIIINSIFFLSELFLSWNVISSQ